MKPVIRDYLTFALILTFAAGCGRNTEEASGTPERVVTVETAPAVQRDWQVVARAVGSLVADEQATIRNEVAGFVRRIESDEGDRVHEGDILLRLDDEKLSLEARRAEARYEEMQATLARRRPLFEQKLISEAELIEAEANYKYAEAELNLARRRLADATVRAPIEGILGRRHVSRGDYAEVGARLFELVKMDRLKLDFDLPVHYLALLRPGQQVRVRTPAYPDRAFSGDIYFVDPVVSSETRTIRVRALVDNEDIALRPNLFVTVEVDVVTKADALVVPEESVISGLGGYWVFIVDDDGVAQRRDIRLGEREPGWLQVDDGLEPGDVVITAGHQRIFPGTRVQVRGP